MACKGKDTVLVLDLVSRNEETTAMNLLKKAEKKCKGGPKGNHSSLK